MGGGLAHHSSGVRTISLSISFLCSLFRLPTASSASRTNPLAVSLFAQVCGEPSDGIPAALRWLRRLPSC